MRIVVDLVGLVDHRRTLEWPEGWPLPAIGDPVYLNGLSQTMYVRTISWHPEGELNDEFSDQFSTPYVYIVIGTTKKGGSFVNG